MKIGIFTPRTLAPMHPRLAAFTEYFNEKNISYDLIPTKKHSIYSRLNWISLYFFDNYSILKNRKKIADYDLILINDLKYLPIARYGKHGNKSVIYETIDNNVFLRAYSLRKKIPCTGLFMKRIISRFSEKEIRLALDCCDRIIVNSKALQEYFIKKTDLLYYYSPFENAGIVNDYKKLPALLYLGEFSAEKGAEDILRLREKLGAELFIYGNLRADNLRAAILNCPHIKHSGKIDHTDLITQIKGLSEKYFLLGASFIKPVHQSYATQEANKDIDYLALGIPIIGNHRKPTEEKILSGCGIFAEDEDGLKQLLSDENFRNVLSGNCYDYYSRYYSKKNFREGLDRIFGNYVN
jgi:glycosyltransferase involved in cell wall biosynthesis